MGGHQFLVYGSYKSGTTALFQAIRSRMQGDVLECFEPTSPKVFAEWTQGDHICAKFIAPMAADWSALTQRLQDLKLLVLVRDPRDILVSHLFFRPQLLELSFWRDEQALRTLANRLEAKCAQPSKHNLLDIFADLLPLRYIQSHFQDVFQALRLAIDAGGFLVRYEDFLADPNGSVYKPMGLPSESLRSDHRWSHVPRTRGAENWRRWLTAQDVAVLRPMLDPVLAAWPHLDKNWGLVEHPILTREESVLYIQKTVNMQRTVAGLPEWLLSR